MSNKNNRPFNGQRPQNNPMDAALKNSAGTQGSAGGNVELPPVTKYGGNPKTVIYEYDITSRRIEDAIKDLFAGVDPEIAQNLIVFSAPVSKKFHTVTVMFDPKTVRKGRPKHNDNGNALLFNYVDDNDNYDKRIQLRAEVQNLLEMISYNKREREGLMMKQMINVLAVDPQQMRKFVMETRPFELNVNDRKMIAIHVDPIKVFHYMLRNVRNEATTKDTAYAVVIKRVKYPSEGESIFTVQRKRTSRRSSNGNYEEAMKQRAAASISRTFRSGF